MNFINLFMNEFIKIIRKKCTVIFIVLSVLSLLFSCALVYVKKTNFYVGGGKVTIVDADNAKLNLDRYEYLITKTQDPMDIKLINMLIGNYKYLLELGIDNVMDAEYKSKAFYSINKCCRKLCSLDEVANKEEYQKQEENISRLWQIIKSGTFEEYIAFCKEMIVQEYEQNLITKEEYDEEIAKQDRMLKYEMGKYTSENSLWKDNMLAHISKLNNIIESRFDYSRVTYVDDAEVEKLEEQILIDEYRLQNNIAPCYMDDQMSFDIKGYSRYKYNEFANSISVIFIGLLIIVLASSTISDEISKGTIKFMLISPCKRSQVLFAKLLAILMLGIISILFISQISVLIGNITFGVNTNNYLYVNDGVVKEMKTYTYETIQYLLRIPELFIYILIGMALSSLTKNTAISTIITSALFVGAGLGINLINGFLNVEFFKYLPFSNFDLNSKILPFEKYASSSEINITTPLQFSITVLIITAILLLITVWDSFRKKEV